MRLFNSLQIVGLFAAFPFLADWVRTASFQGHAVAFWLMVAGYVVFFGIMVAAFYQAACDWDK